MAEGIPYEVRRSHEITGLGLYLGPRCVTLKTKRGQIDPFGASSVKALTDLAYEEALKDLVCEEVL